MDRFPLVLGIIWLAVISPGADFAMVSRLSFRGGPRAGLFAAAGIATACWFHVAYAIFGLELVERLFPHLLDVIRIAGAAYLIYIGATTALAHPTSDDAGLSAARADIPRAFATGMLTNALNPKTSIFVISLYAQVIGPATPLAMKLGYGIVISLSHLIWFAGVAVFLSRPPVRAWVFARQRVVNGIIGAVLVLLGLTLALFDVSSKAHS